MKRTYPKILRNRKNRIARRLAPRAWCEQPEPMFSATNIHYEMADKTHGHCYGGIGAVHLMVQKLKLTEEIPSSKVINFALLREARKELEASR